MSAGARVAPAISRGVFPLTESCHVTLIVASSVPEDAAAKHVLIAARQHKESILGQSQGTTLLENRKDCSTSFRQRRSDHGEEHHKDSPACEQKRSPVLRRRTAEAARAPDPVDAEIKVP
jgi:hypothetical protein